MTFISGADLPSRVLASGELSWIENVGEDANFPRAKVAKETGIESSFGFPVLVGREVVAVLEFFSTEAVEPDARLLEVMAQVGTQLGRVAERERAEEEIRKLNESLAEWVRERTSQLHTSEARLRALFIAMKDVILLFDSAGRYLEIAPTNPWRRYRPPKDLIGKTLHEVLPYEQADLLFNTVRRTLETQQPLDIEFSLPIDGELVWLSSTISPMLEDSVV